jgi:7-cyano-7-deazaguanine synthase|tara:strand:- start:709 stop:1407 length:699 start_codon:yes stop_codon:yes gene_type:complete
MRKKRSGAVVLLSGGLDSATVLAIAKSRFSKIFVLTFDYGQRHYREIASAKRIASCQKVDLHKVLKIDLRAFGASALTSKIAVPKKRNSQQISSGIPVTYVPARNSIFLSFALAWSESLGSQDIFIGANAIDYSGYPDCRPEFLSAYQKMANLATKAGLQKKTRIRIHAPLLQLTKAQIIRKGVRLKVDYSVTFSCYDPCKGVACGLCDSCILRRKGFAEAQIEDPVAYIKR